MLDHIKCKSGDIVLSPGGLECVILDAGSENGEFYYQVKGEYIPNTIGIDDEFPNGFARVRSMDTYTFCEWFTLSPTF